MAVNKNVIVVVRPARAWAVFCEADGLHAWQRSLPGKENPLEKRYAHPLCALGSR